MLSSDDGSGGWNRAYTRISASGVGLASFC
jgi:hypothetical protein